MSRIVILHIFLHSSIWWREFSFFLSACASLETAVLWHVGTNMLAQTFMAALSFDDIISKLCLHQKSLQSFYQFQWRDGFAFSPTDSDLFASESPSDWTLTCETAILNVQWINVHPIWEGGCVSWRMYWVFPLNTETAEWQNTSSRAGWLTVKCKERKWH